MVKRVLLVINQSSGAGHCESVAGRLRATLAEVLGSRVDLHTELVTDHAQAKACVRAFLSDGDAPAALIAAGGGGTLRAVIEGICQGRAPGALPGHDRVRVGALRMGSGNEVARHFGVPLDPLEGIKGIAANLLGDRVASLCVMCCQTGGAQGQVETHYAVSMCGLGQFGRTAGDLARWHRRVAVLRRLATRLVLIETLNQLEYRIAVLARFAYGAVRPEACETVEIEARGKQRLVRLLAGVVLNLPVRGIPFGGETRAEDAALRFHFLPFPGRFSCLEMAFAPRCLARRIETVVIGPQEAIDIRFRHPGSAEFFLDEDPEVARGCLSLRVAGTLAFVPGTGYVASSKGQQS